MGTDAQMDICRKLWLEYEPRLRQISQSKLSNNPVEADEAISETFLALCEAIDKGVEIKNYRAWLYSTLNNIIIKKYREITKWKSKNTNLDSVMTNVLYEIEVEDNKLDEETIAKLAVEIEKHLKPVETNICILRYGKKYSEKEISKMIGRSYGATRQLIYRTNRKIKQFVKQEIKKL